MDQISRRGARLDNEYLVDGMSGQRQKSDTRFYFKYNRIPYILQNIRPNTRHLALEIQYVGYLAKPDTSFNIGPDTGYQVSKEAYPIHYNFDFLMKDKMREKESNNVD